MSIPLVSIIVPMFNDGKFVDEALRSIVNQTFRDFEVIIYDDCSSDNSVNTASDWVEKDSRFKLHINSQNIGMTRNWNRALKEARGKYLVKLDADDVMRPEFIETMVSEMESDEEIAVTYCRTLSCDEKLEPFASYLGDKAFYLNHLNPLKKHVRMGHEWYRMCFSDIQLWHSNAQIHHREKLISMGGWDERWGCASDTDLILRILEQNLKVSHLPYVGIYYRHRKDSVSGKFRRNGWLPLEGALIHLLSISRYHNSVTPLNMELKSKLVIFWNRWLTTQTEELKGKLSISPEKMGEYSLAANDIMKPPPYYKIISKFHTILKSLANLC